MSRELVELSDNQLIIECQNDNLSAFDILFKRYYNKLYHFTLKYIKSESVAEELVMDVLFNIWQKRKHISIENEFSGYLFKAMKNTMFNYIRKKELSVVSLDSIKENNAIEHRSPEYYLECKENEALYETKVRQLSPQRGKIFRLSREEDLTYEQIAAQMGISVNTVKTQMLSTLKFFRKETQSS